MTTAITERLMPTGEGLTFEKVWAMFQETDRKFQETDQKFQETDQKFQETDRKFQETEMIVRRNSKQMGGLHRKFGNLAEHLVAPGISKRFNEMGYHFAGVSPGGYRVEDGQGRTLTQIDILLENGDTVVAVEVKANPAKKDINHHIKRLEILRASRQSLNDQRKILGAIAGAIYEDDVKEAVREAGFFVIEQSGDTMKIDMPEGFAPRVF